MSLYLPEQKLGNHSELDSSSHKFMLKGRQSGSMHRGHSWVFRAETHDTMLAWFSDIKELTEKRGEARNEFVRRTHSRSLSGNSLKPASTHSSEAGIEDDEADQQAFSGEQSVRGQSLADGMPMAAGVGAGAVGGAVLANDVRGDDRSAAGWRPPQQRPSPGGRFPSQVDMQRGQQVPTSPSSGVGSDRDVIAAAGALPGSGVPFVNDGNPQSHTDLQRTINDVPGPAVINSTPAPAPAPALYQTPVHQTNITAPNHQANSEYGEWMAPMGVAAGAGGAVIGAAAMHHHQGHRDPAQPEGQLIEAVDNSERQMEAASPVPAYGTSSVPIPVVASTVPVTRSRGVTESTEAPTMASRLAPTVSTDAPTLSSIETAPTEYSSVRPAVKTSKSVTTISDLDMPGKFPHPDEAMPGVARI